MDRIAGSILLITILTFSGQSAADSADLHPIVFSDSSILLGGSRGGEWLPAAVVAPKLKGGERYRVYGLNGKVGEADSAAPESRGDPCPETMYVGMSALKREREDGDLPVHMVAVAADWNAVPRRPVRYLTNQKVYHEAAAAYLTGHGIAAPDVRLRQVIRVDLEGDGVDEVLVAGTRASNPYQPDAKPGDYSFVFMRKLAEGKVETVTIAEDIHADPSPNDIRYVFGVAAVLDLNGDGVMEIVLTSEYYEGDAAAAIAVNGLEVEQVLIEGCGA